MTHSTESALTVPSEHAASFPKTPAFSSAETCVGVCVSRRFITSCARRRETEQTRDGGTKSEKGNERDERNGEKGKRNGREREKRERDEKRERERERERERKRERERRERETATDRKIGVSEKLSSLSSQPSSQTATHG